jgi:DNA-binding MarR family transcriptional regulator
MIRLLSSCLVGFTIEFDNTFELRMPHKTTAGKGSQGPKGSPWLVSQALWANFMKYVPQDGIAVGELKRKARTNRLLLGGMIRWRHVTIEPAHAIYASRGAIPDDVVVFPTSAGTQAQSIWGPLGSEIEGNWRNRFGGEKVERLRTALAAFLVDAGPALPEYLPVVFPAMSGRCEVPPATGHGHFDSSAHDISSLLSKVLQAFTIDFEDGVPLAMAVGANVLRVLTVDGVRPRDLPALTGVSKEAIAMCLARLKRVGHLTEVPDPSSARGKLIKLTATGTKAQSQFDERHGVIRDQWNDRFGSAAVEQLTEAARQIAGDPGSEAESIFRAGCAPGPDNWRASVKPPQTLPYYPMVLHRGGFPDGA